MHPLNDALPGPYVPVRVTLGALVAHRYTYAPPRCRTSQYHRTFVLLSVSGMILLTPCSMMWDWRVSAGPMLFYWPKLLYPYYSLLLFSLSFLPVYRKKVYTLSARIGKVVASHAAVARSSPAECNDLYYARGAQGVLPMRVGGATSQLDLPSLTPLSVAGRG